MRYLFIFIACLFMVGCSTAEGINNNASIQLSSQPVIYKNQWVRRNTPEVHIQPAHQVAIPPKVLFIPFRVTQQMDDAHNAGYTAARIVWQTWSSMQIFPMMEFSNDTTPFRRDKALQLARQRGADMVVGGFVTYLYAGGTAGDTQVALQLEAIDAHSGQVVWSMAQAALMPASAKKDYLIFAVREKLPSDPLHSCIKTIAGDMGQEMQKWLSGPLPTPRQNVIEKIDQRVHDSLFSDPSVAPSPRNTENSEDSSF